MTHSNQSKKQTILTRRCCKTEQMTTSYGLITYQQWCEHEIRRLRHSGICAALKEAKGKCWVEAL